MKWINVHSYVLINPYINAECWFSADKLLIHVSCIGQAQILTAMQQ